MSSGATHLAQLEKYIGVIDEILTACLEHVASACSLSGVCPPAPLNEAIQLAKTTPPSAQSTATARAKVVLQRVRQFADAMEVLPSSIGNMSALVARNQTLRRTAEIVALESENAKMDAIIADTKARCLDLHRALADTRAKFTEGSAMVTGPAVIVSPSPSPNPLETSPSPRGEHGSRVSTPPYTMAPVVKTRSLSSPTLPKEGLVDSHKSTIITTDGTGAISPPTEDSSDSAKIASDSQQEHTLALIHTAVMLLEEIVEDGHKIKLLDVMQHIDQDLGQQNKRHTTPAFMRIFDNGL
ncbi:hypothetical protein Pelo_15774 [Pelomyxa schiedti]|nr:hypothetical protein Pelo_15774 [Pelomyxa schiedti]